MVYQPLSSHHLHRPSKLGYPTHTGARSASYTSAGDSCPRGSTHTCYYYYYHHQALLSDLLFHWMHHPPKLGYYLKSQFTQLAFKSEFAVWC
jgi:hypothetical protein